MDDLFPETNKSKPIGGTEKTNPAPLKKHSNLPPPPPSNGLNGIHWIESVLEKGVGGGWGEEGKRANPLPAFLRKERNVGV